MPDIFTNFDEELALYQLTNQATFKYYAGRLRSLALTRYKYNNLPSTISPIFLEERMLHDARVLWLKDDVTGNIYALPYVETGNYDVQGIPTGREAFGYNGFRMAGLDDTNSVIMWDNYNKIPIWCDLLMFAKRLQIIERTMDINIQGQKTPYILTGTKQQKATLTELYNKIESNAPAIIVDKSLDMGAITSTPTVTPFIADNLQLIKRNIFNEAMTFLGIMNANSEKRERMVDEEATGNQGMIYNQAYAGLKPRQEAISKVNKMFGTNIEVTLNTLDESEVLNIDKELPEA